MSQNISEKSSLEIKITKTENKNKIEGTVGYYRPEKCRKMHKDCIIVSKKH
jgi:hypothetical protein